MKNLIIVFSILIILAGCSSIELEAVSSSSEETKRILALGLTHEENLIEASKLDSPHKVSVVTLQLTNARDEKIQSDIDTIASEEFANKVVILEDGMKFIGSDVSESTKTGVLVTDIDLHSFHIESTKNLNSDSINHKMIISLTYNSKNKRNYSSANLCDEWGRCEGILKDLSTISVNAKNCNSSSCDYTEVVELNLSNDLLSEPLKKGFTMRINSKRKASKIKVSKAYLLGHLKVVI
jgi:hypothetical protein